MSVGTSGLSSGTLHFAFSISLASTLNSEYVGSLLHILQLSETRVKLCYYN